MFWMDSEQADLLAGWRIRDQLKVTHLDLMGLARKIENGNSTNKSEHNLPKFLGVRRETFSTGFNDLDFKVFVTRLH
jgi:hypothetical protein